MTEFDGEGGDIMSIEECAETIGDQQRTIDELRGSNLNLAKDLATAKLAIQAAIDCKMIPVSSAREGGPGRKLKILQVADALRDVLKKVSDDAQ
jgi:hypothetical protein